MKLATAYASAVAIQNVDDMQNELLSVYRTESDSSSDNASTIPDSPKPPSKIMHSMSTEDARATIRPGTVGNMRDLLGNEFPFTGAYKPRQAISRRMEVPRMYF